MIAFPDHYAALGIDPSADQEVIGAAYRALAKKYHPDTGATTGTTSAERFAQIQQAYEVLGSPEGRSRYDLELLEATQRELDEHLARKQRKITGATGDPPPPPPDTHPSPHRHGLDLGGRRRRPGVARRPPYRDAPRALAPRRGRHESGRPGRVPQRARRAGCRVARAILPGFPHADRARPNHLRPSHARR